VPYARAWPPAELGIAPLHAWILSVVAENTSGAIGVLQRYAQHLPALDAPPALASFFSEPPPDVQELAREDARAATARKRKHTVMHTRARSVLTLFANGADVAAEHALLAADGTLDDLPHSQYTRVGYCDKIEEEVARLQALAAAICATTDDDVACGPFLVRCGSVKHDLAATAARQLQALLDVVAEHTWHLAADLSFDYTRTYERAVGQADTVEQLFELMEFVDGSKAFAAGLNVHAAEAMKLHELLSRCSYVISDEQLELILTTTLVWPTKLEKALNNAMRRHEGDRIHFMNKLKLEAATLQARAATHRQAIDAFVAFDDLERAAHYHDQVAALQEELQRDEAAALVLNRREVAFRWKSSAFPALHEAKAALEPYFQLWDVATALLEHTPAWLDGPFWRVDPVQVERELAAWRRTLARLLRTFKTADRMVPRQVVETLQARVDPFYGTLPLIRALRNPGLRQRHWAAIATLCRDSIALDETDLTITLTRLIRTGLLNQLPEIKEISQQARARALERERGLARAIAPLRAGDLGVRCREVVDGHASGVGRAVLRVC
jgi:dynein heavy chain